MNVLAEGLNNDRYRACPLLKQLVTAGRFGRQGRLGRVQGGEVNRRAFTPHSPVKAVGQHGTARVRPDSNHPSGARRYLPVVKRPGAWTAREEAVAYA